MAGYEKIGSESFNAAVEKFKAFGPLGVTAADHEAIASTPPDLLKNNPGKTKAELMSEQELADWLDGLQKQRDGFADEKNKNDSFAQSILPKLNNDLKASLEYLRSINKLPEGFE